MVKERILNLQIVDTEMVDQARVFLLQSFVDLLGHMEQLGEASDEDLAHVIFVHELEEAPEHALFVLNEKQE